MIDFDDKEIQKAFNKCHFRQKCGDVDICRGMYQSCGRTIEKGQCAMLKAYFSKEKKWRQTMSNQVCDKVKEGEEE